MKKNLYSLLLLLVFFFLGDTPVRAQGWPANYNGVMLQGFYWDSFDATKWTTLEKQADELSQYFSLIWIPQSARAANTTSMGYDPVYWFSNYNSSFGTKEELVSMIKTFKNKGLGTIADIVINHRSNVSNWVDFPKETYKGVTYQLQSTDIVSDDDGGKTKNWADQNGYSLSANTEGTSEVYGGKCEGWDGMRGPMSRHILVCFSVMSSAMPVSAMTWQKDSLQNISVYTTMPVTPPILWESSGMVMQIIARNG